MKQSDIKIGNLYVNRGKGKVMRIVTDIYLHTSGPRVNFNVMDKTGNNLTTYSDSCYLHQFAKWAGLEVEI